MCSAFSHSWPGLETSREMRNPLSVFLLAFAGRGIEVLWAANPDSLEILPEVYGL